MAINSKEAGIQKEANVGYLALLRQNKKFRHLWFSQLISSAGDWFNNVAVIGLTLQLTGSGLASGLVLLANSLPFFVLSPIAGPIIDRFDRRKVIMGANLFGAVFALSFLVVRDGNLFWLVYPFSALLIATASFTNPAIQATVPNLVTKPQLFSATALSGSTWPIMLMVGSGLGGLVSATLGRDMVFILNSLSFLIAALLVWTVQVPIRITSHQGDRPAWAWWRDFWDGLLYLRRNLPVLTYVAVETGFNLAMGVIALYSVFSSQIFKMGDAGIGLLFAGRGLGALIGPFIGRGFVQANPGRIRRTIVWAFMVTGIGYVLFGFSGYLNPLAAFLALVLAHSGGNLIWALSSIVLQQRVPDELRGRIFSVNTGLGTLVNSLSTLTWGFCLQAGASPIVLAWIGGVVFASYGLIWGFVSASWESPD